MSQQAGQSTSTEGELNNSNNQQQLFSQQPQQQQTNPQLPQIGIPQFNSFDLPTQQAILQQLAAARGAGNPAAAAFFANLSQLNTGGAQRTSGSSASGANPTSAVNGSGPSPAVSVSAPAIPNSNTGAPSPSTQTPDVAALQAQLQARLLYAQQQATQAAALRQLNASGSQQTQSQQQSSGADGASKQPSTPLTGIPEWAAAAAASGMLSNLGTDREAIMKQLQALHQSQQNRAKHAASIGVGSPVNPSAASPAAMTAPSPAAASVAALSPAPSANAPTPVSTSNLSESPVPSSSVMAALAAAGRPVSAVSTASPTAAPAPGIPGGVRPGMGVRPPFIQKQQLLNSLVAFYKSTGQPLPPEIFNGEHDGAFKLGGVWIELSDLFLAVFRLGGLIKLMQTSNPQNSQPANPSSHPVWQTILVSKGAPLTLSTPVALPKQPGMDPNAPPQMTTDPVQYLVAGYRAWIFGFEQAMARSKLAQFQKQQAAAASRAAGTASTPGATPATPTAPGPPVGLPAASPASAPTPEAAKPVPMVSAPTPAAASPKVTFPSTPTAAAPTPPITMPTPPAMTAPSPVPTAPTPTAPTPAAPTPIDVAPSAPSPAAPTPPKAPMEGPAPPSASTPVSSAPTPVTVNGTPPGDATKQKRKRDIRPDKRSSTPGRVSTPASVKSDGHPRPKRARYRVEYKPLHLPQPTMNGWDERTISSSFPKNQLGRPTRPAQELQVDVEAVLMGLRSRIPREIGYGMTVLSMLSMPLHEGKSPNLPIEPLIDVYLEVLDLMAESALGERGLEEWLEEQATPDAPSSRSSVSRESIDRMTYAELEQLGSDMEYALEDQDGIPCRDQSGSPTDIILSGLNIIRNFSMLADNQAPMARPELFNLLAALCDRSLMRRPGEQNSRPYSVLEYARVCRDAVSIIANLGTAFDLRIMPKVSVLAIFRMLSSFLVSAWEINQKREPGYGPSSRQPTPSVLSIDRALEAFCCLTLPDHNREAIAAVLPSDELVELFVALVKLFPLSARDIEALRGSEDALARVELVALSVYSLAFLAPQNARSCMRGTAGATTVMTRLVYGLAPAAPDLKSSPFGIVVRRVAETLGVLNGTVNPGGNVERMSFSAGGVDGKGWRFASDSVEPGWLAYDTDRVLEAMGWGQGDGRIWRMDGPTFAELDGLWSA